MTDSQTPFRILIVDDDADAAEAFGRMLSGEGYDVDTVRWRQRLTSSGNGREGHNEHDVKLFRRGRRGRRNRS